MANSLREVCREMLDQTWEQIDKVQETDGYDIQKSVEHSDSSEIEEDVLMAAAEKILSLPFPEQAVFQLYYVFHLHDSEISEILELPYARGMRIGMLDYLQKWAGSAEIFNNTENLSRTCKIALEKLLEEESVQPDILHTYSRHFRRQLRNIHSAQKPTDHILRGASRAAAILLAVSLAFSTAMITNAQFREKVLEWIVETYPKYSKFRLDGVKDRPVSERADELNSFQITYIPDGYEMTYRGETELMKAFRYMNSEEQSIIIQFAPGDGSNNYNTENAEIKSCTIGNRDVLYWKKDKFNMCVARDGEWLIGVFTELPVDEMFKILENIKSFD